MPLDNYVRVHVHVDESNLHVDVHCSYTYVVLLIYMSEANTGTVITEKRRQTKENCESFGLLVVSKKYFKARREWAKDAAEPQH